MSTTPASDERIDNGKQCDYSDLCMSVVELYQKLRVVDSLHPIAVSAKHMTDYPSTTVMAVLVGPNELAPVCQMHRPLSTKCHDQQYLYVCHCTAQLHHLTKCPACCKAALEP